MISVLVTVCGIALSKDLILLLYGEKFHNASNGLIILLLGFIFMFLNHVLHAILISIDHQKILAPLVFIGLTTNVGLNLVFIPRYGFLGAASATVIGSMAAFTLGYLYLGKVYGWCSLGNTLCKPLLAAVIISGIYLIFHINMRFMHLIFVVPTYAFLLVAFKAFYPDELNMVKRFFISENSILRR